MTGKTVEAAGGIVLRKHAGKLIAVVQRAKDDAWVLPRGKLKRGEKPIAAARREVVEETGHRVEVHEYLGAITYRAGGRPKVVLFWRMEADTESRHELMPDIIAVDWLPLKAAIRRLSYPLEKLFLRHAVARALKKRPVKPGKAGAGNAGAAKAGKGKTRPRKARSAKAVEPAKAARKRELAKAREKARAKELAKSRAKEKKKDKAERQRHKAGHKKNKSKKNKNKRKS